MTNKQAWLYAASWGSYMHGGDPGACLYGFSENFRVQSEEHRHACLCEMRRNRARVEADPKRYERGEIRRIDALIRKLGRAPLVSAPEGCKPYRAGVDTSPHYRRGWNDRIAKRGEDYGRVFRSTVGKPVVNHPEANAWRLGERQEYVKGWEDAEARIAALALPDTEGTNEREGGV